ncbi:hypothetical protein TIFTF001_027975 [Ficus carica]|uniref:Uncharacterized protein n=1 Tax=Ficus carica TaxID=3494 RepID=A0AA88DP85_FICCA|nr:hypothetical protein TIFTF001_027975 [Ficus carica]
MEEEEHRTKPVAVFMAFGTKGDVFPVAAIAAGFACDQRQYRVILVTHSSHEYLSCNLAEKYVAYVPVSSPPILSMHHNQNTTGSSGLSFSLQKKELIRDHRQECYSILEKIFGQGPSLEGDFIVINFFALRGFIPVSVWSSFSHDVGLIHPQSAASSGIRALSHCRGGMIVMVGNWSCSAIDECEGPLDRSKLMVAVDLPLMPLFRNPTVVVRRRTGRSISGEVLSSVKTPNQWSRARDMPTSEREC